MPFDTVDRSGYFEFFQGSHACKHLIAYCLFTQVIVYVYFYGISVRINVRTSERVVGMLIVAFYYGTGHVQALQCGQCVQELHVYGIECAGYGQLLYRRCGVSQRLGQFGFQPVGIGQCHMGSHRFGSP